MILLTLFLKIIILSMKIMMIQLFIMINKNTLKNQLVIDLNFIQSRFFCVVIICSVHFWLATSPNLFGHFIAGLSYVLGSSNRIEFLQIDNSTRYIGKSRGLAQWGLLSSLRFYDQHSIKIIELGFSLRNRTYHLVFFSNLVRLFWLCDASSKCFQHINQLL